MIGRLRDLLVDGVLLLLPLGLVALLLVQLVQALAKVLQPTASLFPQTGWFALVAIDLLAVLVLLLLLLGAGALARSGRGRQASGWTERFVLRKIPGFVFYKTLVSGFSSKADADAVKAALVALDDRTVLAFIVEPAQAADGMVTVFVPAAPTPAVGSIMLVQQSRVTPLDVPVTAALQAFGQLGLGLQALRPSSAPASTRGLPAGG